MAHDPDTTDRSPARQADSERYRAAAEATLDQLDWCIAYLHRIRQSPIATAIERNRSEIRRRLQVSDRQPRR
jgi:transposase-like protein